jgi:hypothetical protein
MGAARVASNLCLEGHKTEEWAVSPLPNYTLNEHEVETLDLVVQVATQSNIENPCHHKGVGVLQIEKPEATLRVAIGLLRTSKSLYEL